MRRSRVEEWVVAQSIPPSPPPLHQATGQGGMEWHHPTPSGLSIPPRTTLCRSSRGKGGAQCSPLAKIMQARATWF